jgi:nucleoside-diphosphate-sugar epimerase
MESMVKRVLVTGANGFIGSYLCDRLETAQIEPIRATRHNAGDLGESINWLPLLEGVDVVVHLAARVHVLRENLSLPMARFRQLNVHATEQLARQAVQAGVKRFILPAPSECLASPPMAKLLLNPCLPHQ